MSDSVKWSDRKIGPSFQHYPNGEYGILEGRFNEVQFERCESFELYSCTLCSALVSTEGDAYEIHTDYHRSRGE